MCCRWPPVPVIASNLLATRPLLSGEQLLKGFNLLQMAHGVAPGANVSVKSTSDLMRITLAYAAVQSVFRALRQWRELHASGSDEAYKRQLAAADAASVHTHVLNTLGVAAEMQLDFGSHV